MPDSAREPELDTVLVAGATGFVGRRACPALHRAGYTVRAMSRKPVGPKLPGSGMEWVRGNVENADGLDAALAGCSAALYLVHAMAEGGDYREREVRSARNFLAAAERAGVKRIVYLGGIEPDQNASEHLASRLEVGSILRSGNVSTLELRASMIVGCGSLSWWIVRDLAARLPVMVLPRWLHSLTEPVAIDDVVSALVGGISVPLAKSAQYDIPGPDILAAKEILSRSAAALGLKPPLMVDVPVLTPWLSSHWVRLMTRADWSVAREIVLGLKHDLVASDDDYWRLIGKHDLIPFDEAARIALREEAANPVQGISAGIERAVRRLRKSDAPH